MAGFSGYTLDDLGWTEANLLPTGFHLGADGKVYQQEGSLYDPKPSLDGAANSPGDMQRYLQAQQAYQAMPINNVQAQMQKLQEQQQAAPAPSAQPAAPPAAFNPQDLMRYVTQVPMNVLRGGDQSPVQNNYAQQPQAGGVFRGLNTATPNLAAMGAHPAPPQPQPQPQEQHLAGGGMAGGYGGPPSANIPPWFMKREMSTQFHPGGFLPGLTGGRTDNKNISVKGGSFVIPSDVVSGLGDGNSHAGATLLSQMFKMGPFGMQMGKTSARSTMPRRADGGAAPMGGAMPMDGAMPGAPDATPIVAASSEFIVPADKLMAKFGSLKKAHAAMNVFVKTQRKQHIKTLQNLPPPKA